MGGLLFYVVLICDFMSTGRDFNKQLYYYYYYYYYYDTAIDVTIVHARFAARSK